MYLSLFPQYFIPYYQAQFHVTASPVNRCSNKNAWKKIWNIHYLFHALEINKLLFLFTVHLGWIKSIHNLIKVNLQISKQCICDHKYIFCLLGTPPNPSESIRNLIELPVCFDPFITYIIFASNQAFLPFHKPIPKTDKYLNENNPNSLVLKL